jgi:hypothetical protein
MFLHYALHFSDTHVGGEGTNRFVSQPALNIQNAGSTFVEPIAPNTQPRFRVGEFDDQPKSLSKNPNTPTKDVSNAER